MYKCHAETVSKAGVVLLEKSRLYLDLFNSDVSNVDILVTLWHNDQLSVKKDFNLVYKIVILRKFKNYFQFLCYYLKMAFIVSLTIRLDL